MSSYRAIWTHFRSNAVIFINLILQKFFIWTSNFQENGSWTVRKAEDLIPRDWILNPPPPCLSTALHRHDQVAKYHPVPWLRWHNVSWHQVFDFPENWACIFPEMWDPKNKKKQKTSKSESVWPKMLARSGLIGKNPLPPFGAIWGPKKSNIEKTLHIFLGGPLGPIHPVWGHLVIFGRAVVAMILVSARETHVSRLLGMFLNQSWVNIGWKSSRNVGTLIKHNYLHMKHTIWRRCREQMACQACPKFQSPQMVCFMCK